MSSRYLIPLAVVAALAAPAAANAWDLDAYPGQPKGDWIFRLGWSVVNPADQNLKFPSELYSPELDVDVPVGGYVVADMGTSLSGTVTYMVTDHIGTELLVAYPFTHGLDIKSSNPALNGRIGYVDYIPPTLNLQWHFNHGSIYGHDPGPW